MDLADQPPHPARHSGVQSPCDVAGRDAPGHEGDDLRLGEDGTHAADRRGFRAAKGEGAEFIEGDVQPLDHGFQEPSRSGGAFVVHGEAQDSSLLVDADRLAVLAAHVDDRRPVGRGENEPPGRGR